jgi:prepilin signal peptidase PulO-like enzyme (type II secretory pathway)
MEIILFILGTVFASFLNALMYRIEKGYPLKKMLLTRSHCENCKKELSWYELIPLLSYVFQKGKCNSCNEKINIYYPISELFLGVGFVVIYFNLPNPVFFLFVLLILFSLSYTDYISMSIPQGLTNFLVALGIIYFLLNYNGYTSIIYFLFIVAFYFLATLFKKNLKDSIGFGDFLLFFFLSLVMSADQYFSFLMIFAYTSGIFALLLVLKDRKNLKTYIPLVPIITIAFVLTPIFGDTLMSILKL